ncbi:hypothetical protein BH11ARM2_BH11ARM2_25050 [soil metagenome]
MPKKFVPFDKEVVLKELQNLARSGAKDAAKLDYCTERIEENGLERDNSPALVQYFDDGLIELRHNSGVYKGRMFFYMAEHPAGTEDLVVLRVFRKETPKTPQREISTAESRMKADRNRRKQEVDALAPRPTPAQRPQHETETEETP